MAGPASHTARTHAMLERLVHKADFERLLASRSRLRSAHFALHHVAESPAAPKKPARVLLQVKLSTGTEDNSCQPVENPVEGRWLGCVVPKRHARRSVTRSLIKRQMRSVFESHAPVLPMGLWLLRLSQGFAVAQFVSARSAALATAVRSELEGLMLNMQQRQGRPGGAARFAAASSSSLPPATGVAETPAVPQASSSPNGTAAC